MILTLIEIVLDPAVLVVLQMYVPCIGFEALIICKFWLSAITGANNPPLRLQVISAALVLEAQFIIKFCPSKTTLLVETLTDGYGITG